MKKDKPRVLFVSHEASRTGAPIFLFRLLKWIKAVGRLDFDILVLLHGANDTAFCEVAGRVYGWKSDWRPGNRLMRLTRRGYLLCRGMLSPTRSVEQSLRRISYDAIYVNSIACASLIRPDQLPKGPIITHIHELASLYDFFGKEDIHRLFKVTSHFVVVSETVRDCLIKEFPAAVDKCSVIPGFIEPSMRSFSRAEAKQKLGLSPDSMVVGGSGSAILRKGIDLFIRMAGDVLRRNPELDITFVWVGAQMESEIVRFAMIDAEKLGIAKHVRFVPPQRDPMPVYSAFDVFTMTSREDPFPLVNLEVGALDVPVVGFEGSGGTPELTGRDALVMVPYLDTDAMAGSVVCLLQDDKRRLEIGAELGRKIRTEYTVEKNGDKILAMIQKVVDESGKQGLDQ